MLKKHKPVSSRLLCPVRRTSPKRRHHELQESDKDGKWTRPDSLPPSCPQVPPSPSGSHDRGQKAAPAAAPTTVLVCANTAGPAGPRRSPFVVPWCHLQTVRTHPHFPPCLSPSLPHLGRFSLCNSVLSSPTFVKRRFELESCLLWTCCVPLVKLFSLSGPWLSLYKWPQDRIPSFPPAPNPSLGQESPINDGRTQPQNPS